MGHFDPEHFDSTHFEHWIVEEIKKAIEWVTLKLRGPETIDVFLSSPEQIDVKLQTPEEIIVIAMEDE